MIFCDWDSLYDEPSPSEKRGIKRRKKCAVRAIMKDGNTETISQSTNSSDKRLKRNQKQKQKTNSKRR